MLRINAILHPTDFSPCANGALPYAFDLARRHGADLYLLHVVPTFGDSPLKGVFEVGVDKEAFYQRLREEADDQMQKLLSSQDVSGVRVKRVQLHGSAPGEVITEYAVSENVDLIVLGTHGRRGFRKMLLGSVAQRVIQQAICPVIAVREKDMPAHAIGIGRILVPIDFSVHSVNALAYAKQLAALYEASLDVLHVIDPVMDEQLQQAGLKNREQAERDVKAKAQEKLVWLSKEVASPEPSDMTQHLLVGYPSEQIVGFAEERGADLIVLASHGLRGLDRFPLGSVTERVVRMASCPVFISRPFGKTLLRRDGLDAKKKLGETGKTSEPA